MDGSFAAVWVAAFTWTGWQDSVEYADCNRLLSVFNRQLPNAVSY